MTGLQDFFTKLVPSLTPSYDFTKLNHNVSSDFHKQLLSTYTLSYDIKSNSYDINYQYKPFQANL